MLLRVWLPSDLTSASTTLCPQLKGTFSAMMGLGLSGQHGS